MKPNQEPEDDFFSRGVEFQGAEGVHLETLLQKGRVVGRVGVLKEIPLTGADPARVYNPVSLGGEIRKRRNGAALTQRQLAKKSGVGVRFLSELENGKGTAELAKVLQVLAALGVALTLESR